MKIKILVVSIAVGMMLIGAGDAEAKKGFYMGIGPAYNTVRGDFDGTSALEGGSEIIILPDIANGLGVDVLFGYGITNAWAIEIDMIGSDHSGTWGGLKGDVSYFSFSVNGKYYFGKSDKMQPYFLFGFSGNALLINDGAANTSTGQVGDATLSGSGFNLGLGTDAYITPRVSVNLGLLYRFIEYDEAEAFDHTGSIDEGIDGSGPSFLLTTAYHF